MLNWNCDEGRSLPLIHERWTYMNSYYNYETPKTPTQYFPLKIGTREPCERVKSLVWQSIRFVERLSRYTPLSPRPVIVLGDLTVSYHSGLIGRYTYSVGPSLGRYGQLDGSTTIHLVSILEVFLGTLLTSKYSL